MKIMVVGGGGREHAIIKALNKEENIDKIYALPGNGGIAQEAECISISPTDIEGIVDFASNNDIDFAVVAQDDPLALGAVDELEKLGIKTFGPKQAAARIESSKAFAKNLMDKYNIPTAKYKTFTSAGKAMDYLESQSFPIVIKASGLALGKGVIIAQDLEEAKQAVKEIMIDKKFGNAGNEIVIEEFLTGPEVTVLSFTDGKTIVPMISSMDHKRAKDNDEGLNTGGMGVIAPNPYYTPEIAEKAMEEIFKPTIKALEEEGAPFKGCLYFGLMLTEDGPKVIEYNSRFGDPEAQVVLPLLKNSLFDIFEAIAEDRLDEIDIEFSDKNVCCVVLASEGYPEKYESGFEISLPDTKEDEYIYIAGAKNDNGKLLSSGGRVLGAVALAPTLQEAIDNAYDLSERITFENAYKRNDIGQKALEVLEKQNG